MPHDDVWTPESPFVEGVWRARNEHGGTFTSPAASNWELVFATVDGKTTVAARGPETRASRADFPADTEFFGATFRLGAFMPRLPIKPLLDRQDLVLPGGLRNTFWLHGSAWELPTFSTADVFVERLVRQGVLERDPVVEAALGGRAPDLSVRALQYRFAQATGLTPKTVQQIRRAHRAVSRLEAGAPILETALELGYFDQAHLNRSLGRFFGRTPAQIVRESAARQLAFFSKTPPADRTMIGV